MHVRGPSVICLLTRELHFTMHTAVPAAVGGGGGFGDDDITSLYPYTQLVCPYPVGAYTILLREGDGISTSPQEPIERVQDWDHTCASYHGFLNCRVLPPQDLFVPVLGMSVGKPPKFFFALCRICVHKASHAQDSGELPGACVHKELERLFAITATTIDIQLAVEMGGAPLQRGIPAWGDTVHVWEKRKPEQHTKHPPPSKHGSPGASSMATCAKTGFACSTLLGKYVNKIGSGFKIINHASNKTNAALASGTHTAELRYPTARFYSQPSIPRP